jgi:predicted DNA-binding protein (UPF0251 family)
MNKRYSGSRKNDYREQPDKETILRKINQVSEEFKGYYKANEIRNILQNDCNFDTNECIAILREKYQNSWASRLASTGGVSTGLEPIQPLPQRDPVLTQTTVQTSQRDTNQRESSSNQMTNQTRVDAPKNNKTKKSTSQGSSQKVTETSSQKSQQTPPTQNTIKKDETNQASPKNVSLTSGQKNVSNQTENTEVLRLSDFEHVEKSLAEKQIQLNREAESLNTLMTEIRNLRERKQTKFANLVREKEQLEDKKKQIHEEFRLVTNMLNEKESQIQNIERDFNIQFNDLQKRAELFKSFAVFPQ